ncbi:MSMEG_1061 family FMN-dependent PPOX-type flavoprotein [Baekduia sp.]|uniref:MSMEG_1061 family FMN-dependent PPOX-type flavoprotein n=1 Tax=Baekduia sp. TaxID=2600305 RepID=UPI002D78AE2A|nr:MSMEG_1061 family FMN-dependent PPOX-type flavoprotein [Baekduia sp.]
MRRVNAPDPFAGALTSLDELLARYPEPNPKAWTKDIGTLDAAARALIAASPLVVVASHDADGRADATPRGGRPGFVTVLDDGHLAIPDATGNNRLDTLRNIVDTGYAGLLFLIPGRDQTLRVNGRARVTEAPHVLERIEAVGKPPRTAIVVATDEVYAHCPKALIRSKLWNPDAWPSLDDVPTAAEVMRVHGRQDMSLAEVEAYLDESIRTRLA